MRVDRERTKVTLMSKREAGATQNATIADHHGVELEAGHAGLQRRALRASLWSLSQNAVPKVVSFVAFMVIARFLTPDQIGIAAAIGAILALAELACEQGFGDTIVQRREMSNDDLNFVFWTIFGTAVITGTAMFLAATQIAQLFRSPDLVPYIRFAAIYLPIAGIGVVQQSIYRRNSITNGLACARRSRRLQRQ